MRKIILTFCVCAACSAFSQKDFLYENPSKQCLDSLRTELEFVFRKDQTFRRIYLEAEKKLGDGSIEMEYFWVVVEAQDKVLEKQVANIIDKYGWLGISQIGRLANTAQWAVMQHGTVDSKEKYAPLLKASVLKQESQPIHYARLIDRMLINSDKEQLFGTQYDFDNEGQPYFFPIEAPQYINKRRKELGINSIQKFAKSINIEWVVIQKQ